MKTNIETKSIAIIKKFGLTKKIVNSKKNCLLNEPFFKDSTSKLNLKITAEFDLMKKEKSSNNKSHSRSYQKQKNILQSSDGLPLSSPVPLPSPDGLPLSSD